MRRPSLLSLPLALALAVGLLSGCDKAQTIGGKNRPQRFVRIASLAPSTTELLVSNGAPVAGITSADNYPANLKQPIVAGVKPDYEALAGVKPDLIVYDKELYGDADVQKIKSLGAATFEWDPRTFDDFKKEVYELGSITATETNMTDYVNRVAQAAAAAGGSGDGLKMAIVLPDKGGRHMIVGSKGFLAQVIGVTGATAVGPDTDRFVPLDPEYLITQNPDAIIVAGEALEFTKDPRFANLAAIKAKTVWGLDQDVVLRRGARVNLLIQNIAKAAGLTSAQRAKGGAASGAATP